MPARSTGVLGIVGLVLTAASLLFIFFLILPGVADSTPLNKTYFLQADTSGITGARRVTQWTYFYFCGEDNTDCGSAHPAPAFGKAWDSHASHVPSALIGGHGGDTTSTKYYYLWRFGWVFLLITLFFEVLAFFSAFLACCGRLGSAIAGFMSLISLFFFSVSAALITACFVSARNAFQNAGRSAKIGTYGFAWLWAAYGALLISCILFAVGAFASKDRRASVSGANGTSGGKASFFKWRRGRSQRSYDGRRVKDEYS